MIIPSQFFPQKRHFNTSFLKGDKSIFETEYEEWERRQEYESRKSRGIKALDARVALEEAREREREQEELRIKVRKEQHEERIRKWKEDVNKMTNEARQERILEIGKKNRAEQDVLERRR